MGKVTLYLGVTETERCQRKDGSVGFYKRFSRARIAALPGIVNKPCLSKYKGTVNTDDDIGNFIATFT